MNIDLDNVNNVYIHILDVCKVPLLIKIITLKKNYALLYT
jgi:hypothetical protein